MHLKVEMKTKHTDWKCYGNWANGDRLSVESYALNWVAKNCDKHPIETRVVDVKSGVVLAHYIKRDGQVVNVVAS